MKIELFDQSNGPFPQAWFCVWGLIWLAVLYRILVRSDFDTLAKILWVVVVIFVPIFGVVLYWAAAPAQASPWERKKDVPVVESDVAGTPWAKDPGFTNDQL